MSKINRIFNGWKNYTFPSVEIESLAKKRSLICSACPEAKKMIIEKFMPDFSIEKIEGLVCDKCKCPLSTKLRSENEKCPLAKW